MARGTHPAGYIYPTILEAITDALSGDTIMLEDGAIFPEYGLVIDKNLNFDVFNNGYATIDGGNFGTIFIINNGVVVNLQNLILINGQGTLGGAIFNNGTLTVNNCTFTDNTAQDGGAIYNGGTITYTDETLNSITVAQNGGTLTVINSTFTNNTATGNGGAIYNGGTINVTSSTLTSVTITQNGGSLDVTGSTFTGNTALNGGAIYNGGTLTMDGSSTFTSVTITKNGGTLNLSNSTFTDNTATGNGGAINNDATINLDQSSTLTDSTITENGGTVTVTNGVFTGNAAENGGAISNDATFNVTNSSTLTRTIITRNGGTVTVLDSGIIGNTATANGGAISNDATIDISNSSTFTGPATTTNGGTVTATNSAIIGNTATQDGGAISNDAIFTSAGTAIANIAFTDYIVHNVATVTADFNTIAGNTALNDGGALFNNGILTVTDNTLTRSTLDNLAVATITDNALVSNSAVNDGDEIYNLALLTEADNTFTDSPLPANGATVDAARNWWGSASGPTVEDVYNSGGTVTVDPFLAYTMDLTITASNTEPNVGQQFIYTITVTNNGPDTATDVQVIDGLPAGLTFNSYTASQGTYNYATEIWNVETLASGASAVLQLFVTPTTSVAGTTVTKNVTLINTNQTANATVDVPGAPVSDVTLTKTASNSLPIVGQQFSYTITATNNGPDTATDVLVTDILPAGLTFNSYTASQGTYNSATGIWNVGTLASGASAVLQLFVTPTASVAGTTVINTANTTGQLVTATVVIPATPVANVVLTKTASNLAPNVGQQFSYTITTTNNGPDTATDVLVTDILPAGLTFNSYTASQGTYNSATGIWNVGTLASGASAVLQLFITPTASVAGTTVINTANTTGQLVTATVVIPATPVANVVLTKTASNLAPNVGQQFSYTITTTNNGPSTATGIQVTDILPAGLTFNSYTASQGTYNSATGIWNVGTLVNGASAVLQLFITPTASVAGTTVINTANTTGQLVTATVVIPATPVANVVLTKTASNLAPNVGQQFSYTITTTNNGPSTATDVLVTDILPAGLTFNSYTASQGTYNSATGIWNVGTLVNGASAVLQLFITPTASVAGTTVINTANTTGQLVTATVVIPATPVANVVLTKTASNLAPNVGQQFSYTITTTNNGPDTATDVLVTDILPAGLTFNSYTASQGTYNSATGIWNVGTLVNGASAVLQLFITPTASVAGTTVINTANTTGQLVTATVVIPATPVANVVLTKTASNLAPNVGQQFSYTITTTNNGPDTATDVLVTDILPAGLTFNSYTASQGTYNSATGIWNVGTLVNGASAVLQLFITPTASVAGTTVTNVATITAQNEFNQNINLPINVTINVPTETNIANAATTTKTVGMQTTGAPIAGIVLAILMVLGGFMGTRKK
ncbi:hypothetical protein BK007_10350 [Methanobacterium subterraneum]|uniref:DUF11 domain-containing protein n=1 Tax=Methanobacterium subterraneum TaxID=59277 RepID=A0A2H4VE51_9EURY|nr:hypothetical protein BK007_10350 [Methanobacterium subterraneum]